MNEEWLKFLLGLFFGSALTYLANKKIKFSEMQIQFLIKKLKKYDAIWESYLRLFTVFEDPNFVQRWNNSQFGPPHGVLQTLNADVDRNYKAATFFMSYDMGLIYEYFQKRIFRELSNIAHLENQYFLDFKKDIDEKSKLMCDLIESECSKESLAKHLIYGSFFEFDLVFSNRLEKLKDWRLKHDSIFSSIKTYVDSH